MPSLSSKEGPSHAWVHRVDPKPHPQACWLRVTFRTGISLTASVGLQLIPGLKPAFQSQLESLCQLHLEIGVLGELPQLVEIWAKESCPFHIILAEHDLTWRRKGGILMGFFSQCLKASYVLANYGRNFK